MIKIPKCVSITVFSLAFILLFLGCTTTRAFTTVSNDFAAVATDYKVYAVNSDLLDKSLAQKLEYAFIAELERYGLTGYAWIDLFPPIREYETNDYLEGIEKHNIDMLVFADLQDSGSFSYALFEFEFRPSDFDHPIFVTQINAEGDDDASWAMINAAAARRAVREYMKAAGIERLPTEPKQN